MEIELNIETEYIKAKDGPIPKLVRTEGENDPVDIVNYEPIPNDLFS